MDKIQYYGADSAVVAMTKQEFFALAEKRIRDNAGSGFAEWGRHPAENLPLVVPVNDGIWTFSNQRNVMYMGRDQTVDSVGVSRSAMAKLNVNGTAHVMSPQGTYNTAEISFPPAPDGTKTYDSATGTVVQHADSAAAFAAETATNKVVISRQDYVFIESWHELISDKDVVYPLGNVQYGATAYNGIPVGVPAGVPQGYSAFGEWDTSTWGNGANWSSLTEEQKQAFIQDPENNLYVEDGELIQVRYRARVIEGFGDEWENVHGDVSTIGELGYTTTTGRISPTGIKTAPTDLGIVYPLYSISEIAGQTAPNIIDEALAYKGLCFAVPVALVQRRNQGAYHLSYNPYGSAPVRSDLGAVFTWYNSNARVLYSTYDCFNEDNFGYNSGSPTGAATNFLGDISMGGTYNFRPDNKFYDAIYASDVQDLRMSSNRLPIAQIREAYKRGAIAGKVRGFEGVPFQQSSTDSVFNLHNQANPTWTTIIATDAVFDTVFPDGAEGVLSSTKPNGVINDFPLDRKLITNLSAERWNGVSWSSFTPVIDTTLNTVSLPSEPSTNVVLIHYTTQAHFTQDDVNSKVYELGEVFASSHNGIVNGNLLSSSLTGSILKTPYNSGSGPLIERGLDSFSVLENGKLSQVTTNTTPKHSPLPLGVANDSPAVKTLDYLSSEDGVAKLVYAYKEMVYDVTWGDNNQFEITDNQSTLTDDNGNTVLYGTASFNTQYFIVEE